MITPFFEDALQSESYDLAIGDRIAVLKKEVRCIDVTNQKNIDEKQFIGGVAAEDFNRIVSSAVEKPLN